MFAEQALPAFAQLKADDYPSQCEALLASSRERVAALVSDKEPPSWRTLMQPLEEVNDRIEQFWAPLSHLHGVISGEAWREAYNQCLPMLTAYSSEMGQNRPLYERVKALAEGDEYPSLDTARRQAIDNMLRDFTLSGVALDGERAQRFTAIQQRLSELSTAYSNNVLDATDGWQKFVVERDDLSGVPDSVLDNLAAAAKAAGQAGYRLSLDIPSYLPVMQYCDKREIRRELYEAYVTRASAHSASGDQWDNGPLIVEILQLRAEQAALLGFSSYAEKSLASKMAPSCEAVLGFLDELAVASKPVAEAELKELQAFAKDSGLGQLEAWDVPYFSEKLREARYAVSQEELRPYFPVERVLAGLFKVAGRLFDVEIVEREAPLYHQDARCFALRRGGDTIAEFYLDLYARANKRGGAWMADCRGRRRLDDGSVQRPVAFLVCNFTPPSAERPSLLTHNEVTTLFHEFGHGLHHMLTQVDCLAVSGINGVAWDAVELPSQFLENWCWEKSVIPDISGHYQSGEALPEALLDKLLAAKNFQSGMQMLRQIEFALFDFRLHMQGSIDSEAQIDALMANVREGVSVLKPPAFNRFQNSFSHIFAGGYAAGYYSYKWAEVLSADAFSLFEESGVMDAETGLRFRKVILEQGGARDAGSLFKEFRGREPANDALLRHSGIAVADGGAR